MKSDADILLHDLHRYRYLLGRVTDQRFSEALKELIDETEARLHAVVRSGDRCASDVEARRALVLCERAFER